MSSKDDEIQAVAARLSRLLDELNGSMAALTEILTRPGPTPPGDDERLVAP